MKLPHLSLRILEIIKERGRAQISDLETLTQANRSTIKAQIKKLVHQKYLIKHGNGRSVWYSL